MVYITNLYATDTTPMEQHELFLLVHAIDFLIAMVFLHQITVTWLSSSAGEILGLDPIEEFANALQEDNSMYLFFGVVLTLLMGWQDGWMVSPIVAAAGFLAPVYLRTYNDIKNKWRSEP